MAGKWRRQRQTREQRMPEHRIREHQIREHQRRRAGAPASAFRGRDRRRRAVSGTAASRTAASRTAASRTAASRTADSRQSGRRIWGPGPHTARPREWHPRRRDHDDAERPAAGCRRDVVGACLDAGGAHGGGRPHRTARHPDRAGPAPSRALASRPRPGCARAVRASARRCRPRRDHPARVAGGADRSEEHTSELQSRVELVCRLLLEKKKKKKITIKNKKKKKKKEKT